MTGMLIPQFSIRSMLLVTAACAGVFSIVALGVRGEAWAIAVSAAIGALALVMLLYGALFGLVWLISVVAATFRRRAEPGQSPFRQSVPPSALVLAGVWVALGSASGWGQAQAESGSAITLAGAGLNVVVDTRWVPGGAYRPVSVTVTPTLPVAAHRTLTIEFLVSHRRRGDDFFLRVSQDVEVPAGSGPVRAVIAVPQMIGNPNWKVNVIEEGKLIPGMSSAWSQLNSPADQFPESLPSVLIVAEAPPDTSGLAAALGVTVDEPVGPPPVSKPALPEPEPPVPLPTAITRSVAELPGRWIDYTNCDVVCVSLDKLKAMGAQNPKAFRAIVEWTSAGGNLWVAGVGQDSGGLAELESLLRMRGGAGALATAPDAGWSAADKGLFGQPLRGPEETAYAGGFRPPRRAEKTRPAPTLPQQPRTPPAESPFVMRQCGLGLVVGLASDAPFPGEADEWRWLLNSMGPHRWLWPERHGLSQVWSNPEFWNFPIPGVGLPPLGAFRILITLFVLAIGPLNYLLLRRRRRLHLLVVTIPLGAAAVTLALFGYALVADGLGTRVRVRSVTVLDQRRGQAACWARLSYYCGLTPGGGLRFPADVAVLRFDYVPTDVHQRRQDMTWDKDQRLTSGWLAARTPAQLLTLRSRPAEAGLAIARPKQDGPGLEVSNRLGARVQKLLVCGEDGRWYWAEEVERDATVRAEPIEPASAVQMLRQAHQANQPEYPPGLDRVNLGNPYSVGYRPYPYRSAFSAASVSQQTSRLESALEVLRSAGSGGQGGMPPRSYVALVDESPEVVLGTPAAREEAGFHVILGTW